MGVTVHCYVDESFLKTWEPRNKQIIFKLFLANAAIFLGANAALQYRSTVGDFVIGVQWFRAFNIFTILAMIELSCKYVNLRYSLGRRLQDLQVYQYGQDTQRMV